jgi:CMP/dCMP kinase
MTKQITIAIDGYSSCGKSTLAKALAKELNYVFIDSGAMYRAIAYLCLQNGWNLPLNTNELISILPTLNLRFEINPETLKPEVYLNNENLESKIRNSQITSIVSEVASIKEVREKLVLEQRKMGENGGIIMDGRDIGSVVFPNAELKLFLTADPYIRAERRFLELKEAEPNITIETVLENLNKRDYADTNRKESPLTQVKDAIVIDNSYLTPSEQLEIVLNLVNQIKFSQKVNI